MVCNEICSKGVSGLKAAVATMDPLYNTKALEKRILLASADTFGNVWTPEQDNVPIYIPAHTNC